MRRTLPATLLAILALAFGSAASAQDPAPVPPCPGDLDCSDPRNVVDKTKEKLVEVTVFANGAVEYPCLEVKRGFTSIAWKVNPADAAKLDVEFKDCAGGTAPKKPAWDPSRRKSRLDRKDLGTARSCGYLITVTDNAGRTVRCDPKLIINP